LKPHQKFIQFFFSSLRLKTEDETFLLSGSVQAFIIKVFGLIIAFLLQIVLARILGVEQFGDYIYVLTCINVMALFTKLGYDRASKKFLPIFYSQKKYTQFYSYVRKSSKSTFLLSLIILLITVGLYFLMPDWQNNLFRTFIIGSLVLLINNQLGLFASFLEAVKEIYKSLIPSYLVRSLTIIGILIILESMSLELNSVVAMAINLFGTFIASILVYKWFSSYYSPIKGKEKNKINNENKDEWRKVAFSLMFIAGAHLLLVEVDTILIGVFSGTESAGIYQVAMKLGHLAMFGFSSVEIIIAPNISRLYAENKLKDLQTLLSKGAVIMLIMTLPALLFLYFFGQYILELYGIEFIEGLTSLKILLGCQLVNAVTGAGLNLMAMTKYEQETLRIIFISLVLNIVLNLILIPKFGMEGAAIATGFTTVFWNTWVYLFVRRKLRIDPSVIFLVKKRLN